MTLWNLEIVAADGDETTLELDIDTNGILNSRGESLMNLVSSLVGLSIMGTAMPMLTQMAITPTIAARRAENLLLVLLQQWLFRANEGASAVATAPDGCTLDDLGQRAWSITCEEGENTHQARVTRSFRLALLKEEVLIPTNHAHSRRITSTGAHQCHVRSVGHKLRNDWPTLGQCIPQVLWSKDAYLNLILTIGCGM